MGRYGAKTTALEVINGKDLSGKVAVVTGGNSGIGTETVRCLATAGARVIFSSRDPTKGAQALQEIQQTCDKGDIKVAQLDLADLPTVKAFAAEVEAEPSIDFLILNAGVMAPPKSDTKQGFELQMGTNIHGHFYLVKLLESKLKAQENKCRIVIVSSVGHGFGAIDLEDLHFKKGRRFNTWWAYGQSKLAAIIWAKEINRRFEGTNVTAYSLNPGMINTPLFRHNWLGTRFGAPFMRLFAKSVPQGAATTVYAAVDPDLESHPGAYLDNCNVSQPWRHQRSTVEDTDFAKRLYDTIDDEIKTALATT